MALSFNDIRLAGQTPPLSPNEPTYPYTPAPEDFTNFVPLVQALLTEFASQLSGFSNSQVQALDQKTDGQLSSLQNQINGLAGLDLAAAIEMLNRVESIVDADKDGLFDLKPSIDSAIEKANALGVRVDQVEGRLSTVEGNYSSLNQNFSTFSTNFQRNLQNLEAYITDEVEDNVERNKIAIENIANWMRHTHNAMATAVAEVKSGLDAMLVPYELSPPVITSQPLNSGSDSGNDSGNDATPPMDPADIP